MLTTCATLCVSGEKVVVEIDPPQVMLGVLVAAFTWLWISSLVDTILPLWPRSAATKSTDFTIVDFIWSNLFVGWEKDSARPALSKEDIKRGARSCSPLGTTMGFFQAQRLFKGVAGFVFLPLWFLVVVPVYYTVALGAHIGSLLAACILFGGSIEGLGNAEPTSVAAASISILISFSARSGEPRPSICSEAPAGT
jgi:hypothetical protein